MVENKKEIKVYLQYPWSFPDSSYYNSMLEYPPKNISYINANKKKFSGINSSTKFKLMLRFKKTIRNCLKIVKVPNITRTRKGNYDLIHCAHCLSLNKKPWVVDIEHYWNFSSSSDVSYSSSGKNIIKKLLKKDQCKSIMPWTESARKTMFDALKDKTIENKTKIVTYAFPSPKIKKMKHDGIHLFFSGRYFLGKGGSQALKVIDYLTKKYDNVTGTFLSQTPKEFLKKYKENKKIEFHGLMPLNKIMTEIYPKSDIFIYPGFSDSFGFVLVEALAFGLPVITVNGFARRDIIEDKKDGFVISRPKNLDYTALNNDQGITQNMIKKTSNLIENASLRNKMSKYAIKMTTEGKFSLKVRHEKLKQIYEEAIK